MESLHDIRGDLLELHRTMVEDERREYEKAHGKVSPGQLLNALVNDEAFAWLRPMTALLVELDEAEAGSAAAREVWTTQIRQLLRPDAEGNDFQRRYDTILQRSPDVALAHGVMMRALRS